jgi:hypothetical protein
MTLTIGVVIPCYKAHIPLLGRVLWSINRQSRLPDMVIVSCSSSEESDILYRSEDYKFPLKIYTHRDLRNTSQNKNFGTSQINTDIVTYFDSDDIMHPQRIETIYECFNKYPNTKLLIHSLRISPTDLNFPKYDIQDIEFEYDPFYICEWKSIKYKYNNMLGITNGNSSIIRTLFKEIQFDETDKSYGKEDVNFNVEILKKYWNDVALCKCELTWYFQSGTSSYNSLNNIKLNKFTS